jgi:hypothetical protein
MDLEILTLDFKSCKPAIIKGSLGSSGRSSQGRRVKCEIAEGVCISLLRLP